MGRFLLSFVMIVFGAFAVAAQADREAQADEVKSAVAAYGSKKSDVRVMLRSLVQMKGPIMYDEGDSFLMRFRTKGGKRVIKPIRYADVLYLKYGETELNFIPRPDKKQHGAWNDINAVFAGTRILVVLEGDRTFEGWANAATEEGLVVLNEGADRRVEIPKDEVIAYYGVLGRSGGAKSGAAWGAKAIFYEPVIGLVATGVGAVVGEALRKGGTPILIYSK